MIWIIQLFSLASSACGTFAATPTVYEAEEDGNLTISWDCQSQTDLSRTNMACFSLLNPQRVLYEMINGVEESQHQQFIGRVQCDRVPLREGRVRLHLSRLRAEDSGSYQCELQANYNDTLRRWELVASVSFVLNVNSNGKSSEPLNTPKPEPADTEGAKQHLKRSTVGVILGMVTALLGVFGVVVFIVYVTITNYRHHRRYRDRDEVERTIIQLLLHMNNTMSPITQSNTAEESYINCFRDETTSGRMKNDLSSDRYMEGKELV